MTIRSHWCHSKHQCATDKVLSHWLISRQNANKDFLRIHPTPQSTIISICYNVIILIPKRNDDRHLISSSTNYLFTGSSQNRTHDPPQTPLSPQNGLYQKKHQRVLSFKWGNEPFFSQTRKIRNLPLQDPSFQYKEAAPCSHNGGKVAWKTANIGKKETLTHREFFRTSKVFSTSEPCTAEKWPLGKRLGSERSGEGEQHFWENRPVQTLIKKRTEIQESPVGKSRVSSSCFLSDILSS